MNSPFFRIERVGNSRYDVIFRFNLKMIAKIMLVLIVLAIVAFIGYWLVQGAIWAGGAAWTGLCWLASQWMWLLGILLLALLIWGLSKINWKNIKAPKVSPKTGRTLLWVLAAIILLLLCFLAFRSCGDEDNKVQPEDVVIINQDEFEREFNEAFDFVVTSRAYLDGVQNAGDKIARALVGLKYVDGKSVSPRDFAGKTYDEAVRVIAKDWRGLVQESLNGTQLSKQQLVTLTLFAMRNGKYGFVKSDFLKAVKAGEPNAEEKMALHKANGEKRELGVEAQQYLWVLKNMWKGNISAEMLLDLPSFSYKDISLKEMYNKDGEAQWNDALLNKLRQHAGQTPREALGL